MAVGKTGLGAGIKVGKESTYGTAVTTTVSRPVRSVALQTNLVQQAVPDLYSGNSAVSRRHHKVETNSGGSVSMTAAYDALGIFFEAAMGSSATSGGSDPYTHTYTLANALPSLTVDVVRGNSARGEKFEGVKINTLTMASAPGEAMTIDLDMIAETSQTRGTPATLSITEKPLILASNAGQFTFNSVSYDLLSFRVVLNNNLERRPTLGSLTTAEPIRAGETTVSMEIEIASVASPGENDTLLSAQLDDTNGDATITFTSGAVSNRSIAFTLHNAWIESATDPISDAGLVTQSLTFRGESDGTDLGFKIVAINGNSSAIGN